MGALSCALIAVGSCHGDLTENFLQLMMDREPGDLTCTHIRFLALALALLYLGKQKAMETTMAALKAVSEPLSSFASTLLEICAYAGMWCVSQNDVMSVGTFVSVVLVTDVSCYCQCGVPQATCTWTRGP